MRKLSERVFRHNVAMLLVDAVGYTVGIALLGPTTIMPSLVQLLGGGPLHVGLLSAIQAGGFCLPQLVAGRYVANRPLVKRYVVVPATLSRISLALLPLVLWVFGARAPAVALAAVLLIYLAFYVIDALSAVGWFDLMAKAVPEKRRGRVMGAALSLSSLVAIGAGVLVRNILARADPFPANYVLVTLMAVGFLAICPFGLALIREPRGVVESGDRPRWREYFPQLATILRTDARFAWLAAMMWLGGLADMANAFYVLYAGESLGMPLETIGLFISAGVVGGLLSGLLLGPLGDHRGSASVIKAVMAARCASPLLALLAPLAAHYHPALAPGLLMLVFAQTGMATGTYMIGYMNYVLEIAPPGERPMYVALANALNGLLLVAPLLAGWLVKAFSYETLFAVTLGLAALGLAAALQEPKAVLQGGERPPGPRASSLSQTDR